MLIPFCTNYYTTRLGSAFDFSNLFLKSRNATAIIGKKNTAAAMVVDPAPKIMLGILKTVQRDKTTRALTKSNVLNFMLDSLLHNSLSANYDIYGFPQRQVKQLLKQISSAFDTAFRIDELVVLYS